MRFTAKRIRQLMRANRITIKQLAEKMQVRNNGCENHLIFQDYIEAITN